MTPEQFLNRTKSERLRLLVEDKDFDYIRALIAKLMKCSIEHVKDAYQIEANFTRKTFTVKSDLENTAELFYAVQSRGIKPESITQTSLRIDFDNFIAKIN